MHRRNLILAAAAAGIVPTAFAQKRWPEQPVKWLVPYPPGGGTDNLARTLAESMHPSLGQPIVIDNRPGGSTNIAADLVAHARADGYTVMSADNALLAFNEHLFRKLPFNPEKDFTYIGGIGRFPLALVVTPKFPAQNFKEFLAYVKAHPGKVNYASPGAGSPHHLAMELFKNRTGTFLTHIPYRGAAPAMQDIMGGQVDAMFLDLAAGLPVIRSGKVRALAIGSATRSPLLPDVPTFKDLGISGVEVYAFQGMVAPAGLPQEITLRLNRELNKALADPVVLKKFADFGFEPLRVTPDEFRKVARDETRRWGPVIQAAHITLD